MNRRSVSVIMLIIGFLAPITSIAQKTQIIESFVEESFVEKVFIRNSFIDTSYSFIRNVDYAVGKDTLISMLENNAELYYFRSCLSLLNGDIYSAFQDMTTYSSLKKIRFKYEAKVLLAKMYYLRLNKELSEITIKEAIRLDKKRPEAYIEQMRTYAKENNFDAGVSFAEKWSGKFPDQSEWELYRGLLEIKSSSNMDWVNKLEILLKSGALTEDVLIGEANFGLAEFYFYQNSYSRAIEFAEEAILRIPYNYYIYGFIGKSKYENSDVEGALLSFNKMEEFGSSLNYLPTIAIIHETLGNSEKACSYYKRICSWRPSDQNACSKVKYYGCMD